MRSKELFVLPKSDYFTYQPSAVAARLYLAPIAVGHFYYEPSYYLQRNKYDSFLLMHVVSGTLTGVFEGRAFTAEKDMCVFLDCYRPQEYGNQSDEPLDVVWIHFDGPLARDYYELITAKYGNTLIPSNIYPIMQNMKKILSLFRDSAPIREAVISAYLTQMMTELLNTGARSEAAFDSSHPRIVENSLAYINEHFGEPLSLDDLAKAANLSPYYFTRVFSAETGFTPHQYLIATRLNSAKFLLQSPHMSVKEIAFQCGFNSESSFCSTFKKWEHMTPGDFRARVLQYKTI